jgi:hypothetical protein
LLAQDRDARSPSTADLDDETARQMVRGLLDAGTVTPVVDQRTVFIYVYNNHGLKDAYFSN